LASTAKSVQTVDWHQGDAGTGFRSTLGKCLYNLDVAGMLDRIRLTVGRFSDVLPWLADHSFDLVYVDGAHDYESVQHDLTHARRLVKPGGVIALHDWPYDSVQKAAFEQLHREPDGRCETLAWYHIPPLPWRAVFIGLPHYGGVVPQALWGLQFATQAPRYTLQHAGGSLLAMVFNSLWCTCLNTLAEQKWTHFGLHHSDIEAPAGWADTLMDEMDATGADVLSSVVAIKDARGLTSTGVRAASGNIRRLTLKEVFLLPETFTVHDVIALWQGHGAPVEPEFLDHEKCHLAVNTGLWLCRLDAKWIYDFKGFNIADGIVKHDNGEYRAHVLPEDWNASRWWASQGLKVLATRKIPVLHHGHGRYPSDHVWGEWETDQGDG